LTIHNLFVGLRPEAPKAQQWYGLDSGKIRNVNSYLCLDAPYWDKGTQLIINDCDLSSLRWQIK
jgi:hypothetical protein